jgi:hypothetical protein
VAVSESFPAARGELFEQEVAAGTLVHLGQQWEELHVTLMGSDGGLSSIPSHVVLGGSILGCSEDDSMMVIALRPHEVSEVADYLASVNSEDIRRLVESNSAEIEEVLGEIDDWEGIRTFVSRCVDELRDFYAGAAKEGAAVMKLVY